MGDREIKVTCRICGQEFDSGDSSESDLILHLITAHPMETVTSKGFIRGVARSAYRLGEKLGQAVTGGKKGNASN